MTSLDPNNQFGLALQPPPPTSQSTTKFDMYQSKLFTNPATSSLNNLSYETTQQQQLEIKNNKKNTGIITTSSWRIGEAIAKKQLKQHFQQLQENDNRSKPSPKNTNSNENSPIQTNANKRVKQQQKYTECQLISPNPTTTKTNIQQQHQQPSSKYNLNTNAHIPLTNVKSSAPPPPPSSTNKNNTNKSSYDVQKYMQAQKSKRLHEIKSEKEKLTQKEEERKKRLQDLYQKQRRTTSASAGITTTATTVATATTPTSSSTMLANNIQYQRGNSSVPPPNHQHLHTKISKSTNSGTDTQKVSNFYEQDMSKVLMDKISYLLNDNDKLVDRQRARFELNANNRARETQVVSNRTSQLASGNHRSVSSSGGGGGGGGGGKRVEFNTNPAVVNGSGRDHYNVNENLNNTVDIETDENNKENYSEESSFDYSSSVTLTPTANSFKSDGKFIIFV